MTIQTDLSGKDDQFLNTLSKSVTENLIEKIENHFDDLLDNKPDVRIESMVILDGEGEKQHSQCRLVRVKLFFQSSGSRLRIEKSLIELKLSFGNSCNRNNQWSNDAIHYDVASRRRIRKRFVSGAFSDGYFSAKVSNVLLCPQIKLDEDEYNVSDDGSILTLTREGFESVSFDEFATTPSGQMRVCLNYLRKIKYIPMPMTDGAVEVDLKQKYLWIMSLVSSALSVVSLTLGLTVYFCVPNLRSIPGKIIMLLMTSLLFALVFHQVSYFAVNNKSGCIAVATVLHLSWLSVFLCTQTANFHMWRTFTSMEVGSRSERILLKYVMYIYGLPVCLVCVVLATGLAMHSDVWWGYGGSKCFINDINLLIGLFICPVALICVLNILFFTLTFRAITRSPTAENNQRKRNELAIFARLTTVTGVSWLLQIIDSFLPFTYFTFISTIINSLQGLSIFIAFIVNKRVWGLLLERFNPSDNANSSKTTRHTT
ncbi:hypothetical protein FSP39_018891 [Pinctada imbricata]|uniref:G-protein coupled receptors family 2 profile 2 domain-containing protein n=1 Tax=Pinctada imbricata TaxID=66713 RepID=A0AA88XJQ0_PINIB|nr:hypothetical protein FSP39_018891 [Pinctada imbricata]